MSPFSEVVDQPIFNLFYPCGVSFRELTARVRAIFRRMSVLEGHGTMRPAPRLSAEQIVRGDLSIDSGRRRVLQDGAPVELTAKEFELLRHFASHPGRVFTREELVDRLWGPGYEGYEHTVNSHINRLRGKINGKGPRQRYIETVWGVGYRFAEAL